MELVLPNRFESVLEMAEYRPSGRCVEADFDDIATARGIQKPVPFAIDECRLSDLSLLLVIHGVRWAARVFPRATPGFDFDKDNKSIPEGCDQVDFAETRSKRSLEDSITATFEIDGCKTFSIMANTLVAGLNRVRL
jgi:hypothetical protein